MTLLLAWGSNEFDQFDGGNGKAEQPLPVVIPYFHDVDIQVKQVVCGGRHTMVLTKHGYVYTFGCPIEGALGRYGNPRSPGKVDIPQTVLFVAAGGSHSVAVSKDCLYVWGSYGGSLPIEFPLKVEFSEVVGKRIDKVVCGKDHSLILAQSEVYLIAESNGSSMLSSRMQDKLNSNGLAIEKVPLRFVVDVFAGGEQNFALTRPSRGGFESEAALEVYGWGNNTYHQLGIDLPHKNRFLSSPEIISGLDAGSIKDICSGDHHSLFLLKDGRLLGAGLNIDGQVGLPLVGEARELLRQPTELQVGCKVDWVQSAAHFNFAGCSDGRVRSWGLGCGFVLGNGQETILHRPVVVEDGFLLERKGLACLGTNFVVFAEGLEKLKSADHSTLKLLEPREDFFAKAKRTLLQPGKSSQMKCESLVATSREESKASPVPLLNTSMRDARLQNSLSLKRFNLYEDAAYSKPAGKPLQDESIRHISNKKPSLLIF